VGCGHGSVDIELVSRLKAERPAPCAAARAERAGRRVQCYRHGLLRGVAALAVAQPLAAPTLGTLPVPAFGIAVPHLLDYRGGDYDLPSRPVILRRGNILKLSNFCPKCGKVFCVCFSLAVGSVPMIEAYSPPETECSAACTERPLATKPWSPDAPEHDYGTTNQPTIEQAAETGAVASVPWGWEEANRLPPAYRYPRRHAAINQPDESAWMGPLVLRSTSTSA
jgi:hypothetical protein